MSDAVREARCQCGQLSLVARGEPVRISVCHCFECQRRTGSVFAMQARFPADMVEITGEARQWSRRGDEGGTSVSSFCHTCGSTVFYRNVGQPGIIAVPVGGFADPSFPPPRISIYEERKHGWVTIPGEVEHHD